MDDDDSSIENDLLESLLADDAKLVQGRFPELGPDREPNDLRACLWALEALWPRAEPVPDLETDPSVGPATVEGSPTRFGRFEVIEVVGRGGFGVVFRARDPRLGREVALKVPRTDMLLTTALRKRFLREARAVAVLDHPWIVPIFDADMLGPYCYLATAFCEGPTLSAWLRSRTDPVPPRLAARLLQKLAEAVAHAHDRGVLHRDLKPSNVLLQLPAPGHSESEIVPRISDFGLAKFLEEDDSDESRGQAQIGSPPYMAPEQATGKIREVGPTTDVHALGATLYQVLTGRPPFTGESRHETLMQVALAEPVPPRTLRPGLPRDLETIVLTCLKKDPKRRYGSAAALAEDLDRFLQGLPIRARPASVGERLWKWTRRRPWQAFSIIALIVAAVALSLSTAWLRAHNRRLGEAIALADQHALEAGLARELTDRYLHDAQLRLADQAIKLGLYERAQDILEEIPTGQLALDRRGFLWRYLHRKSRAPFLQLRGGSRGSRWIETSPNGRTIAQVDETGRLFLWDLPTERLWARPSNRTDIAMPPAFSPGGRYLAAFEAEPTDDPRHGALTVWDTATAQPLVHLRPSRPSGLVESFAFLTETRLGLAWRDPDRGRLVELWELGPASPRARRVGRVEGVEQVAFAAGRGTFATVEDQERFLYQWAGADLKRRRLTTSPIQVETFTPDGRLLVGLGPERELRILDLEGDLLASQVIPDFQGPIVSSADGRVLAFADGSGLIHLWDRKTEAFQELRADGTEDHTELRLALSPDGRKLAVACRQPGSGSGPVTLWDVSSGRRLAVFPGRPGFYGPLTFTTDGHSLLLQEGRSIRRWFFDRDFSESIALAGHSDEAWAVAFSPDGRLLATGSNDTNESRTIKIWEVATGRLVASWFAGEGTVAGLAFHPNGRLLASAHLAQGIRLWDLESDRQVDLIHESVGPLYAVAFSPDGRWLAAGGRDQKVWLWNATTGRLRASLQGHTHSIRGLAFSPDGRTLVSGSSDQTIRLWDVASASLRKRLTFDEEIMALAFRGGEPFLAAAGLLGALVLWDLDDDLGPRIIHGADFELHALALAPDGQTLAVAGTAGKIILWDTITGQEILTLDGHDALIHALIFSPDGFWLASCAHDGTVRLWPTREDFAAADQDRALSGAAIQAGDRRSDQAPLAGAGLGVEEMGVLGREDRHVLDAPEAKAASEGRQVVAGSRAGR